jgi:hypothetical protein
LHESTLIMSLPSFFLFLTTEVLPIDPCSITLHLSTTPTARFCLCHSQSLTWKLRMERHSKNKSEKRVASTDQKWNVQPFTF